MPGRGRRGTRAASRGPRARQASRSSLSGPLRRHGRGRVRVVARGGERQLRTGLRPRGGCRRVPGVEVGWWGGCRGRRIAAPSRGQGCARLGQSEPTAASGGPQGRPAGSRSSRHSRAPRRCLTPRPHSAARSRGRGRASGRCGKEATGYVDVATPFQLAPVEALAPPEKALIVVRAGRSSLCGQLRCHGRGGTGTKRQRFTWMRPGGGGGRAWGQWGGCQERWVETGGRVSVLGENGWVGGAESGAAPSRRRPESPGQSYNVREPARGEAGGLEASWPRPEPT